MKIQVEQRLMERNMSENSDSNFFDLTFQGFNLTAAILSMVAAHSGLKVVIKIDSPLSWDFEPEIVTIYPTLMGQLFQTIINIRFFEKISSLFPSLVYPQRIITIIDGKKFRLKTTLFFDFILKRDREMASLPILFSKFPVYQVLSNKFQNGLLVQEFRFDRNMAIIEMLLKCKQLGVSIIQEESSLQPGSDSTRVFDCLPFQFKKRELRIDNFQLSFKNNIRIVTQYFELSSQARDTSTVFQIQIIKKIEQEVFIKKAIEILKSVGIDSPENYREELISIFQNQFIQPLSLFPPKNQISDLSISTIHDCFKSTGKRISRIIGTKLNYKKWLKTLEINRFDGTGFRYLQAECDEKFDLAKQTGIEYEKFCYYFYRYHNTIDDLIELAYQQLNLNRKNPHQVWEKVENDFRRKIEKQIFG